jgi:hypothetical protein
MNHSDFRRPGFASTWRPRARTCGSDANAQNVPAAGSLPTLQQVMDKYVAALGGHDAIYKHKSMTVRGASSFRLPARISIASHISGGATLFARVELKSKDDSVFAVSQGVETLLSKQGR